MALNMKASDRGLNLIKSFEELKLTAYYDGGKVLTIGYGHTNNSDTAAKYPVKVGQTITAVKAEEIFKADVAVFESVVNQNVTYPINQNQFDALVSFTFNRGKTVFKKSPLLQYLNNGKDNSLLMLIYQQKKRHEFMCEFCL